MSDPFRERVDRAQRIKDAWKPVLNDWITGELLEIKEVSVRGRKSYALVVKDDETGEEINIWGTTVIMSEIERQEIHIGERIGLKYLGREKDYHYWIVMVDRPEPSGDEMQGMQKEADEPPF